MRIRLASLLGMALILTACSGSESEPVTTIGVSSSSASATPSAVPAPTTDPPSSSPAPSPEPSITPSVVPSTPAPSPTTAAPSAAPPPAAAAISPRGNLVKQVGELAGIRDADGEYLVSFTVNDIIVDIPCTEDWADPPEHGHFVTLDVSVETSPRMLDSDLIQQFDMSSYTFDAIRADGVTSNAGADSVATSFCLSDAVLLPSTIGPGEKADGLVLLDVEDSSGTLVYNDIWTDSGWEYSY